MMRSEFDGPGKQAEKRRFAGALTASDIEMVPREGRAGLLFDVFKPGTGDQEGSGVSCLGCSEDHATLSQFFLISRLRMKIFLHQVPL